MSHDWIIELDHIEKTYGTGNNRVPVLHDVNMQVRFTKIIVTIVGQEPGFMLGDVNHDGKLSVADVTALIHWVLSDPDNAPAEADVNESGSVTVADVTALISLVLSLPSE